MNAYVRVCMSDCVCVFEYDSESVCVGVHMLARVRVCVHLANKSCCFYNPY